MQQKITRCILFFLCLHFTFNVYSSKIYFDTSAVHSLLLKTTLTDASSLLKSAKLEVIEKLNSGDWKIVFQLEKDPALYQTLYEANTKETQKFSIASTADHNVHTITLRSQSEKGLSNAIYYWMQNYLGFSF